ncbi:MAG: stage V sporulation protein AC [Clostridia bacterium]|nr:stage V sporulation protein AC [Clostridia bacterium]MBQ6803921.1 stage V sporulation protein AC [Clostridia bacterium]
MEKNKQSAKAAAWENYAALVKRITPKSKLAQGCLRAFWVGGSICTLGQALADIGISFLNLTASSASAFSSITLIFLTALLTGLGVFDRIARYAGAGTVVPITGFANAMVSPAMEFKPEGWVLGTGARLFTIAGPVLVYGISASVVVGILYYFIRW